MSPKNMPPNARDDVPNEADESSNLDQDGASRVRDSNHQNNSSNNNQPNSAQNGHSLSLSPTTSSSLQPRAYIPSARCINVSSNISNGAEISSSSRLAGDSNATIYIVPSCDNETNSNIPIPRHAQPDANSNSVTVPQHLFLLPSVPFPTNVSPSSLYPAYNQAAPPDYSATTSQNPTHSSTQHQIYQAAPYCDPPPEYDSWSYELTSSAREALPPGNGNPQGHSNGLQYFSINNPHQTLSTAENSRGQIGLYRPRSTNSTTTLCCTNEINMPEAHTNHSFRCNLSNHCTNRCSDCNNPCSTLRSLNDRTNSSHIFNISGNNRCGENCRYQFPIQNDSSQTNSVQEAPEEAYEEDYDRMTNTPSSPPEYLTVKRWVMVSLLLLLLTTFSLLLGVSMQHFQLLKKFGSVSQFKNDNGDERYKFRSKFGVKNNNRTSTSPPSIESTSFFPIPQESETKLRSKINFNEKRKRHTSSPNNCNNILDESIRDHLKLTLSKFQSSNIANSKLLESICDPKKNYTSFKPGIKTGAEVERTFKTHTNDDSIYSINVCSEVQRLWLTNAPIKFNAAKLFQDLQSQDCLPIQDEIKTIPSMHLQLSNDKDASHEMNCIQYSKKWKDITDPIEDRAVKYERIMYSLMMLLNKCSTIRP